MSLFVVQTLLVHPPCVSPNADTDQAAHAHPLSSSSGQNDKKRLKSLEKPSCIFHHLPFPACKGNRAWAGAGSQPGLSIIQRSVGKGQGE